MLGKLVGKFNAIAFNDNVYIQIFMSQEYISHKSTNEECIISEHIGHMPNVFQNTNDLSRQPFL